MAAILDFQVASQADLFSIPMRITVPNLVLKSQFARFCLKMDFSCSTTIGSGEPIVHIGLLKRGNGNPILL